MKNILITLILLSCGQVIAQHEKEREQDHNGHKLQHKWYISLVLGHSFLPAGEHFEEQERAISVPTWGLDIGYLLSPRFALIWANEVHLQEYVINNKDIISLRREYPYITALEIQYLITHNLAFLFGPGIELERNQNFFILRAGLEMDFMIGEDWAFIPSLFYESKEGKFGSLTIGFGIARGFK